MAMQFKSADCIIVAAGSGTRLGAKTPKAFVRLGDAPLFAHSLLMFAKHPAIGKIILVVPPAMTGKTRRLVSSLRVKKEIVVVKGGTHRWQSVKNGVESSTAQWVMIHDSARPFVTKAVVDAVIVASAKYDAVIAATPEVDTVRKFSGDRAGETLDRNEIVRVQTPQLFNRAALLSSFRLAETLPVPPTDEAMLMEKSGTAVGIARGDPLNFKITTKEDFEMARALWERGNSPQRRKGRKEEPSSKN
jgi:2-C-methyl-D-erythritol 4-phosphate cytidylyltransferase